MMEIEVAWKCAVIANKASLEAEQEKDAAEKELEILKSRLGHGVWLHHLAARRC